MTKYLVPFLLCFMALHRAMVMSSPLTNHLLPKMIVFGLDKTLWPFTIGDDIYPPFQKKNISDMNSDIIDAKGRVVKPFPEVKKVLVYLYKNHFRMGIASSTKDSDGARHLCSLFGWNKYFLRKMIYPYVRKDEQLIRISQRSKVKLTDILYFDDQESNTLDLERIGVTSVIVEDGMTIKHLMRGFLNYSDKYSSPSGRKPHRNL